MLVVFVDAVHSNVEFGRAYMDAIPRDREIVELELSCENRDKNPLPFARFRVDRVTWEAKNVAQIENWMRPWDSRAQGAVTLRVWADDDATKAYIERVVEQSKRDKQGA